MLGGRPLLSYSKVQRFVAAARRNRTLGAPKIRRGDYLNIGCGPWPSAGFYNVDLGWRPGIELVWDVTRRLPFPDKIAGGLFTEHMLEHITLKQCLATLAEFHRVLAPGSVIRIVVPDGELYFDLHRARAPMPYAKDDVDKQPFYTPMMSVNRIFRAHGHQFIYDLETMAAALLHAGFRDPVRRSLGVGSDPKLLIDRKWRAVESLYVEAIA